MMLVKPAKDTVMDATMMNNVTIAERITAFGVTFFRLFISEKRAVKPNTVVTPVEIKHSSRNTLYAIVNQDMSIAFKEANVGNGDLP